MYIKKLSLTNFRNYEKESFEFINDINIIFGNNAQGKTNILEAIELFANGKSFRNANDSTLCNIDKDYFFNNIEFETKNMDYLINISYDNKSGKKYININNVQQKKLSSLIGKLQTIIFKPEDIEIVTGSPSVRRKFIDSLICSLSLIYLDNLTEYNKIIVQKNKLLKNKDINNEEKDTLLDSYDKMLSNLMYNIILKRYEYIEEINSHIGTIHKKIVNNDNIKEILKLKYKNQALDDPKVNGNIEKINVSLIYEMLKNKRRYDISTGSSSFGIHRDDINININGLLCSVYGSQGQKKSSVLSLKIAQLEIIEEKIGEKPVLLLDDFMAELDDKRIRNFLELFKDVQIILTTTSKVSIEGRENKYFYIQSGKQGEEDI